MPKIIPARPRREERELEALIRGLIHRHDRRVRIVFPRGGSDNACNYSWNGKTKTLRPVAETYETYLHDVAHWLVATPKARRHHEFGLGPDPSRISDARCIFASSYGIEVMACNAQMLLALAFDLDTSAVNDQVNVDLPDQETFLLMKADFYGIMPRHLWAKTEKLLRAEAKRINKPWIKNQLVILPRVVCVDRDERCFPRAAQEGA